MTPENITFHMRIFRMQPKPILLGFNSTVGKSGKDTLCEMLNGERFAFADALKQETAVMLGHTSVAVENLVRAAHDQKLKDQTNSDLCILSMPASDYKNFLMVRGDARMEARSVRWHLQQYGEFRRSQDMGYWLNRTLGDIEGFMATTESFRREFIIITDVRMKNEADWVRTHGGIVMRIERDWAEPELDNKPKHISDTDLDDYGLPVIKNRCGQKEAMVAQLKEILHANRIEI